MASAYRSGMGARSLRLPSIWSVQTRMALNPRGHTARWSGCTSLASSTGDEARRVRLSRRQLGAAGAGVLASGLVGLVLGGGASRAAETRVMDKLETELQDLQLRAIQAYRAKDLRTALDLFDEIITLDPRNPVWYERRGQVNVDLKEFAAAVQDFNKSQEMTPKNYRSLGLLGNRGLAYEGLSKWTEAAADYTEAIELGKTLDSQMPYFLNSRGNCYVSLGQYDAALSDFNASASVFSRIRNISGYIYAASNAALVWAQLGEEERAVRPPWNMSQDWVFWIREMQTVARRAPGSIDMRAALAAIYWSQGEEEKAEEYWNFACTKINSGIVDTNGPLLDGCGSYRDMDWLTRIRRWPPVMVSKMDAFVNLRSVPLVPA